VRDLGWGAPADPVLANGLPMHHFTLAAPDERTGVELHWRAQWYDDDAHSRGYLDRAITVDGLPVLSDADVADCVLLAWVRDGFHGVRLAADYAAALQLPDAANDAAPIDALTQARFIGRLAAHHVAATPPPTGTPRLRARIAVRAATRDRPRGTRAVTLSQSGLVDVLACDRNQIPRRMSTTWFWPTSFARWARPTAPRPLLPVFQCASALRTGWDAIVLLACRDKPPSPTQLGSVSDVKGQAGRIQT
jgi:hypothetical protein